MAQEEAAGQAVRLIVQNNIKLTLWYFIFIIVKVMYTFSQLYKSDIQRGVGDGYTRKLLKYFRLCQTTEVFLLYLFRWRFKNIKEKRHIEIYGKCNIGPGLYLGHVYGITINPDTVIGKNCNIHKGVTIGQQNRGLRKGTPTIGDSV